MHFSISAKALSGYCAGRRGAQAGARSDFLLCKKLKLVSESQASALSDELILMLDNELASNKSSNFFMI